MNIFQAIEWMVNNPMREMRDSDGDLLRFNENNGDPQIELKERNDEEFNGVNPFCHFILSLEFEPVPLRYKATVEELFSGGGFVKVPRSLGLKPGDKVSVSVRRAK